MVRISTAPTLSSKRPSHGDRRPQTTAESQTARTGKDLILATVPFASDQPLRSWWCVLSTAALLAGAVTATLWIPFLPARVLASVLSGLLFLRLFVIYHDNQHNAILGNSRLAAAFMTVFGIWALSPSSIWRASHNHHHNHNSKLRGSQIGSFPIMTAESYRRASRGGRRSYLASRHPLTMLFGYVPVFLYGMCVNPFRSRPKEHWDCLVALVVHVAIAVALITGWGWTSWLLFQTLPSLIACAMGAYLFYVQHNFPGVRFRDKTSWTYETAALESSSFLNLSPVMHWFTGNIGYHHVHHLNPRIPFYRLPEAMRGIPELQHPTSVTLLPSDVYRCLSLKVWDADRQQMTGVPC